MPQHKLIPSPSSIVIDNNNTGLSPRCYYFATVFCFRRWPEFIYLTAQQSRTCARAFHPPKEGGSASLSRLKARNSIRVIGEPWLPSRASAIHLKHEWEKLEEKLERERERDNYYVYLYLRIMYRLEVKLFHRFFSNEKSYRWSFFSFPRKISSSNAIVQIVKW